MRNSRITTRPAALAVAVVMAFGTSAVGAASLGQAQLSTVRLSPATSLRAGENIDGMVPFTQPVHIEVALKMRDRAGLDSYIASAATAQRITGVRPTLSTAEVLQRHAPTDDQVKAVVDFLSSAGFTNIVVADNRMLVSADGTADVAQAAFQTSLARVTRKDGGAAIANTTPIHVPASLQGIVLAVLGLQDVHRPHVMSRVLDGPQPLAVTGHYPNEFSSIYGGTGVATAAGVTVGIITQGKLTQTITDLNSFTSAHGFPTVTTQTVNTGGTSNDTSGIGEWNLDSQDVVGMAGGQVGKIIFYNEPTLANSALTANINTVVSQNAAKIINMSLGECEKDAHSDGSDAADDQLFATAVAQGQTFSISTGDFGADECQDGGVDEASNPANSPYVVAVSGTTLNASTSAWSSETVWVDSGGSQSTIEPKPSWQTLWSGSKRGVADVAFDGDPNSGAKVIVNGGTQQIGGTSLSAPIFAGMWARVLAVKGTSVGFAGPIIYQLPASDFHDITSGNNNGSTAAVGYDLATGRGSMILSSAINHIGGGGGGGNVAPVANFSFTTNALVANFTDSSSDSDGTIVSRSWNFGDGGTSTATNPSHTYASAGTYSVSLTVTDDGGATNTKTSSVTVTSGGGGGNVLQNGVAVTGLAATTGNQLTYTMVVPSGATNLKFVTSGGSGDGDLYVKFGSAPTTSSYDCRSWATGNSETCNITTAQAGTYYVMINAYSTFSGMSLTGSYSTGGGGGTTLSNGVPVTGLSASSGNWTSDYTLVVPSGATNLKFQISGGTGDADLYVRLNATPTTSSYTCRPYLTGNNESCTWSAPTAGTYHVRINAYTTFSGVTLTPSFTP